MPGVVQFFAVISGRTGYTGCAMSKLPVQFLEQGFHRALFDAMPLPVFVVDEDVCIFDYNAAAGKLLGKGKRLIVGHRGGEVLACIHVAETPGGCGRSLACRDCVVRNSVRAAARGRRVTRQPAKMKLVRNGKTVSVELRVSCQPFKYGQSKFILLVLEGLDN
jgi:PAS domain-containing protein